MSEDIIGRGWAFPLGLDDRNQMAMAHGDAEIRQAIYIILTTSPGERVMRPDFGSQLHELVFAPANSQTAALAERYATEALERWEPRIELVEVTATPNPGDLGVLLIEVAYRIKGEYDVRSLVYPFYLTPA